MHRRAGSGSAIVIGEVRKGHKAHARGDGKPEISATRGAVIVGEVWGVGASSGRMEAG